MVLMEWENPKSLKLMSGGCVMKLHTNHRHRRIFLSYWPRSPDLLSPRIDGMTIEHLNSIFLGDNRDDACKKQVLKDYVAFFNRYLTDIFGLAQGVARFTQCQQPAS